MGDTGLHNTLGVLASGTRQPKEAVSRHKDGLAEMEAAKRLLGAVLAKKRPSVVNGAVLAKKRPSVVNGAVLAKTGRWAGFPHSLELEQHRMMRASGELTERAVLTGAGTTTKRTAASNSSRRLSNEPVCLC